MKVDITGKHFEVTSGLREYIETEMDRLTHFYEPILDARATVEQEGRMYKIEIVIHVHGQTLKAADEQDAIHPAIGGVIEKMVRQLKRVKGKQRRPRGSTADEQRLPE